MASSLFVTATDTDAGKSFVSAALTRALRAAGKDVLALKPVSCGRDEGSLNGDVTLLLAAQDMQQAQAGEINLYDYAAWAAPLFAARSGGNPVDGEYLIQWCRQCSAGHELCLIEAIGGLMAPLGEGLLVSDWLAGMPEAAVLLVVRARLGGINQALLSLDKLQRMGRSPAWVLVNAADAGSEAMLEEHREALAPYLPEDSCLMSLPYMPQQEQAVACLQDSSLCRSMLGA
ncbi:MAG: dethiobiotin synthase [Mariprofundaceae bacterium]|nr:dethiobiotin synthase [Mariprofundaceae bacterium]